MAHTEKRESAEGVSRSPLTSRLWRYAPLLMWMAFIFFASTQQFSASNTSRIIRPVLLWLFPDISEERLTFAHFIIRKLAHLTEYAILALLAARAFITSSQQSLRRRWFLYGALLVAAYALSDEFHQSFIPSRTGTIYDSLIDITGGFIGLLLLVLWRKVRRREEKKGRRNEVV
jgi:VanZ family protein